MLNGPDHEVGLMALTDDAERIDDSSGNGGLEVEALVQRQVAYVVDAGRPGTVESGVLEGPEQESARRVGSRMSDNLDLEGEQNDVPRARIPDRPRLLEAVDGR